MRSHGIAGALPGMALLVLATAAAAQPSTGKTYALQASVVSALPQGLQLADRLALAGDPPGAELLRWSLLELQLDAWAGRTTPPMRVHEHIRRAALQPPPGVDTPLGARWEAAFARWATLRWVHPPLPLPDALDRPAPDHRPLAPGVWAGGSAGDWSALAVVRLDNQGPAALTMPRFVLQLERPGGSLALDCMPPIRPLKPGPPGSALADAGPTVPPGGGRPFACRARGEADWAPVLARAASGQPAEGERLRLVPGHLAGPEEIGALLRSWAEAATPAAPARAAVPMPTLASVHGGSSTWRTAAAVGAAAALLLMLLRTLHARIDGDVSAASVWLRSLPAALGLLLVAGAIGSPWGQWLLGLAGDALGQALRLLMARFPVDSGPFGASGSGGPRGAASGAALFVPCTAGLYLAGRLLLRVGFSRGRVRLATWLVVLVLGPLSAAAVWSPPTGEGWSRAVPLVLMLLALGFFLAVGVAVELLHGMNELMDREGTTWPAEVLRTLRRSLDFRGLATRAEWWGYLVFGALLWAVTRSYAEPWDRPLGLALLLPLPALVVRRLRGLTHGEAWGLAGLLALLAYELLRR